MKTSRLSHGKKSIPITFLTYQICYLDFVITACGNLAKDIKTLLLPSALDDILMLYNNSLIEDFKAQLSFDEWMRMKSFTVSKDETSSFHLE